MVDEKEGHYEGQEEEEYHFSDDQANYEIEPETSKVVEPEKLKMPMMQQLTPRRKIVIGTIVFVVLLAIVYKVIMPTSPSPTTEFSQTNRSSMTERKPVAQPASSVNTQLATMEQQAEKMPVAASPAVTAEQPSSGTPPSSPPFAQTQPEILTTGSPVMGAPPSPPVSQSAAAPLDASQTKAIMDRLATLEQQNAAMMNLIQTEYAQKIADTETQATMMRGKMTEVTKRVNKIESSLAEMTRLLQTSRTFDGLAPAAPEGIPVDTAPAAKMAEPKLVYTVQAIIPGRAWLKSESGDTVTVAEGDVLKDYGRVVKIDPYDGVVNIDTGRKVITLSYGVGGG